MTPFLDQLGQTLGVMLGVAGVGTLLWGAATKMRGRQAVDEKEAILRGHLSKEVDRHDEDCSKDRTKLREDLDEVIGTVSEIVVERRTERRLREPPK